MLVMIFQRSMVLLFDSPCRYDDCTVISDGVSGAMVAGVSLEGEGVHRTTCGAATCPPSLRLRYSSGSNLLINFDKSIMPLSL